MAAPLVVTLKGATVTVTPLANGDASASIKMVFYKGEVVLPKAVIDQIRTYVNLNWPK